MTERSSKRKKRDHDFSVIAHRVVQEATGEAEEQQVEPEPLPEERHAAAVTLGRLGGKKGGKARAAKLTPKQRSEIAKKAAEARWHQKDLPRAAISITDDDHPSS